MPDRDGRQGPGAPGALLLASGLLLSGEAALINEVVWQRSLRRFLGGSEALASMIVVLVFMAGLGLGSLGTSRRVGRWADPLRILAAVEASLALLNLGIALFFRTDLVGSLVRAQGVAAGLGLPVLLIYALSSLLVLLPSCLLMGATFPISAEVCQRHLGLQDARVLGQVFFAATLGSAGGAVLAGFGLVPLLGLSSSLIMACGLNLAASLTFLALGRVRPADAGGRAESRVPASEPASEVGASVVLAGGLGFCSLAYEMTLLRLSSLQDGPFPHTFACVLTGFLLFWSLGAYASSRTRPHVLGGVLKGTAALVVSALLVFGMDQPIDLDQASGLARFFLLRLGYFPACFAFGYSFGKLMSTAAVQWGHDVGRLSAWNTGGACLGVVLTVLVGYEVHHVALMLAIGLVLLALASLCPSEDAKAAPLLWSRSGGVYVALCALVLAASPRLDLSRMTAGPRLFFGRGGVVAVYRTGNVSWDGLWQSSLSSHGNHVGTKNWLIGVCPILSHPGDVRRACVVGLGTGITAGTIAKLGALEQVDVYEINPTLKTVLREYPEGTLRVVENPKIRILWQDARAGLALRADTYDLIVTQPLWLRQAGSTLLNSAEFFALARQRLRPGGIFALYSNGSPAQAFAVRQTAASVFPYRESFFQGYLLILSNEPIDLSEKALADRFASGQSDPLWREIRARSETGDPTAVVARLLDQPRLPWGDGRLILTDDWPLLEYPASLEARVRSLGYGFFLPTPH